MANWCFTTYKIVGDVKELGVLNDKLTELDAMETALVPNGFGVLWLGCLVRILGGDEENVYCRGEVTEFNLNKEDGVLTICTQTAWTEMDEVRHFLKKVYPSLEIFYYEEEEGCEIYRTNDKDGRFFPERYVFGNLEIEGTTYYDDDESLLDDASESFGTEIRTIEDLKEIVGKTEGYFFHRIQIIDN